MAKYRRGVRKVFILYKSLRNKLREGGGGIRGVTNKKLITTIINAIFSRHWGSLNSFRGFLFLAKKGTYHHNKNASFSRHWGSLTSFRFF